MRLVVQRVSRATVSSEGQALRSIGQGICALVGLSKHDTNDDLKKMANKLIALRIFSNQEDDKKWDKSVKDMDYEILLISQFTLQAVLKGNKPDFHAAMEHVRAKDMFENFVSIACDSYNSDKIKTGYFGCYMTLQLNNSGPVTIFLDSNEKNKKKYENQAVPASQ